MLSSHTSYHEGNTIQHKFISVINTHAHTHLSSLLRAHSKGEESRLFSITRNLELSKSSSVALNGLGDFPLHRVQLHVTYYTAILIRKIEQ